MEFGYCQTCSKLIDSDEIKYSIKKLNEWKLAAENRALEGLIKPIYEITEIDKDIINIIPMNSEVLDGNNLKMKIFILNYMVIILKSLII